MNQEAYIRLTQDALVMLRNADKLLQQAHFLCLEPGHRVSISRARLSLHNPTAALEAVLITNNAVTVHRAMLN